MVKRKEGTIVCVSSVVGKIPIPYRSSYTASKHALQAFADCLRAEMAVHHVKVLVASPGYVATSVSQNALTGSGAAHGGKYIYNQSTARHSFVDINNFTSLIVCVCSDGSRN